MVECEFCNDCEYKDKVYFKDNENGQYYEYEDYQIFLCMKHNKFVIDGELVEK